MPGFRFHHPIEIRYGDLDPQGHVNNAKFLTYFEQARIAYITYLELWPNSTFMDIGIILAEARVTFLAPVLFGQKIDVGVRVSRLGKKSMEMEYSLEETGKSQELAHGSSALVAYDYYSQRSIPIPDAWRQAIQAYEGLV